MEVRTADCPLGAKCEEVKEEDGRQILYRCPWFQHLRGKDPQTDAEIDEWRCAIAWTPMLLVENAKQGRQAGAAIESFRNEMVKAQNVANVLAIQEQAKANGKAVAIAQPPTKTING